MCRQALINYHKGDSILYKGLGNWIEASRALSIEEKRAIVDNYLALKMQENLDKIIIADEQYTKFFAGETRHHIESNVDLYLREAQVITPSDVVTEG
jgi:hypothetical protein